MIKKYIISFNLFLTLLVCAPAHATENLDTFSRCPAQLSRPIHMLYQIPEFRQLLVEVEKEGPIRLVLERGSPFEGYWESYTRTIAINAGSYSSNGQILFVLVMELHNASTTRHFNHLIYLAETGQIGKDAYVEAVERMEYNNCIRTRALLERGAQMGIFPRHNRWYVSPTFEEHYQIQKANGHSQWIARAYNELNPRARHIPFRGTLQSQRRQAEPVSVRYVNAHSAR